MDGLHLFLDLCTKAILYQKNDSGLKCYKISNFTYLRECFEIQGSLVSSRNMRWMLARYTIDSLESV